LEPSAIRSRCKTLRRLQVSEVTEAGVKPFDEVKSGIEARVKREKKTEKTKEALAGLRQALAPGDSLRKIESMRPGLSLQHVADFTLGGFVPGIGRDMASSGRSAAAPAGNLQADESSRGVLLIQLWSESAFDSAAYKAQREPLRTQLLNEKKNRFFTDWSEQLKKGADIVDNRDTFYR